MKLINTVDESDQGIKDEIGREGKMAFTEVSSTLSRLVWVVCFAFFFHSQEGAWYLLARKADSGRMVCLEIERTKLELAEGCLGHDCVFHFMLGCILTVL